MSLKHLKTHHKIAQDTSDLGIIKIILEYFKITEEKNKEQKDNLISQFKDILHSYLEIWINNINNQDNS